MPAGSEQPGFRIMDVAVSGDGTYSALAGDAGIVLLTADGTECWRSRKVAITLFLSPGTEVFLRQAVTEFVCCTKTAPSLHDTFPEFRE
ncbi:hypothetical protein [Methanogenium cariaci]|uniref:hypothetical protein n=1 Tax=Methanogenium cariaci TaxID=2197 RepID=UPI000780BBB5|nr:hypothetical protein [Methanogenium cariaci]